jgi:hypothetical protein
VRILNGENDLSQGGQSDGRCQGYDDAR